jgi:FAD/FMN-containing dehydrogenase
MSAQDLEQRAPAIIDNAGKVEAHPDDAAVDRFAAALKAKLADARAKGRGGWQDKDDCPQQRLSDMLRTHVEKGDPRDVANFAMFLHQRGESILPGHQPAPVVDEAMVDRYLAAQAKAVQEIDNKWGNGGKAPSYIHPVREACRAGLTAALARAQGVQS